LAASQGTITGGVPTVIAGVGTVTGIAAARGRVIPAPIPPLIPVSTGFGAARASAGEGTPAPGATAMATGRIGAAGRIAGRIAGWLSALLAGGIAGLAGLAGWLAGGIAGLAGLAGWLAGGIAGLAGLAGWLAGWFVDWLAGGIAGDMAGLVTIAEGEGAGSVRS
jgi:hypothetical protein